MQRQTKEKCSILFQLILLKPVDCMDKLFRIVVMIAGKIRFFCVPGLVSGREPV